MPDSQDVNGISLVIYVIDQPIGSQDDLPKVLICSLGDDPIGEGELGCALDTTDDAICEVGGSGCFAASI